MSRKILFIGGPLHEFDRDVPDQGNILPMKWVEKVHPASPLLKKNLCFAHYRLGELGKLTCYRFVGYSQDAQHITWVPSKC